jgi:hypothetical protein
MNNENWKPVVGYEGLYEVSDQGNVRSVDRWVNGRFCIRRYPGKLLSKVLDKDGYYYVTLSANSKRRQGVVHRLVAAAFIGPCPDGCQVRHKNAIRTDCRPFNLEYGTAQDNANDRQKHGNTCRGSSCGTSKLSENQVLQLKQLHSEGASYKYLSELFSITSGMVGHILNGRAWKHI